MKKNEIKKLVRQGYGRVVRRKTSCCPSSSCGCSSNPSTAESISREIGYSRKEIQSVPDDANLGLGCGNPVALAGIKKGETVLDLGSGPGLDCFLAAQRVGPSGRVIGVDMTPEMIDQARLNAGRTNYRNVEFRLGEIEKLPVTDNSVDVIISNCVINLSPEKMKVFQEAFRVLKPGGRLLISDLVVEKELPKAVRDSVVAYVGCLAGAVMKKDYLDFIKKSGFQKIEIIGRQYFPVELMANDPTAQAIIKDSKISPKTIRDVARSVVSLKISALKPKRGPVRGDK